jgi:hypothetical protein
MKICIAGNCQAQHMEMMLGVGNGRVEVKRLPPVFMMRESDKDEVYGSFESADLVFMQRVSKEYDIDWIGSDVVRDTFGDKVTVWPNIYFDGYFPGVQYVYLNRWGKLLSPLGEYHFEQIRASHRSGRSVEDALASFAGEQLFDTAPDPIGESLDRLRSRECDVDVPISDVIEDCHAASRQFYTPNHPVNGLLGTMLKRLTERAGVAFDAERAIAAPYRLDECYIAASPAIVRRFDLPFDRETIYRGREVLSIEPYQVKLGDVRDYDLLSLVEGFYRLYDIVARHD